MTDEQQPGDTGAVAVDRRLAFVIAALVAFAGFSVALDRWTVWLGLAPGLTASNTAGVLQRHIARVPPEPRAVPAVLILGDSTVVNYPSSPNVPARLGQALGRDFQVVNAGFPGSGYAIYYLIADEIVRVAPDAVVVNLNLGTFGPNFAGAFRSTRVGAAGLLSPRRLFEAVRLPLAGVGLTVDEIVFQVALSQLGLRGLWTRVEAFQSRFVKTRDHLDRVAGERLGFPRNEGWRGMTHLRHEAAVRLHPEHLQKPKRLRREELLAVYGKPLTGLSPDHPNLERICAFLCEMRDAGIPTLVYLNPTNVDQMFEVGASDAETLGRSVEIIRQSIEQCGGQFVDLHGIFRDDAFTDGHGHMRADEEIDAPRVIAERLVPPIREMLPKAPAPGASQSAPVPAAPRGR